ncbi:MAG: oligosaccharide flippase family protein [Aeoliella sp.]
MSMLRQATASSGLMALSLATVSCCRFLRNFILARMLLTSDFGIGATFSLTLTFLELITEMSPAKQLIQAKEGNQSVWQGVAHLIIIARGILISAALFLAAGPIAHALNVPDAIFAFQYLAIVPLLRGFVHCDVFRFQRELRLGRLSAVEAVPELVSLACAPICAWWFGNYLAFLVLVLLSAALRTILSHFVAVRPYRIAWDRSVILRFLSFGWPLMGNGLLIFLVMHGERVLVAMNMSLSTLGAYSVALGLAFTPATLLAKLHGSVALPVFSKTKEDAAKFRRSFFSSAQIMCMAAGMLAILFLIAGAWLVGTLYGERYLIASQVIPWIGLLCAMRIVRTTPSQAAIAVGDTKIALISNLSRLVSFGAAAWLLTNGFDIAWVPACGFLGELSAYLISISLLKWRHQLPVEVHLGCFATVAAAVAGVWMSARVGIEMAVIPDPLAAAIGLVAFVVLAMARWKELRSLFQMLVSTRRGVAR